MPKNPRAPVQPPWAQFERRVLELLRALGYQVEADVLVGERQTDIVARYCVGSQTFITVVECKYSETGPIGVVEVESFLARVRNARHSGKADRGLLTTNTSFSREAKALLASQSAEHIVQLATPESLLASYIPFERYLDSLIQEFEASDVASYYVPLAASATEPPTDGELRAHLGRSASRPQRITKRKRSASSRLVERHDALEDSAVLGAGSESSVPVPNAELYIMNWVSRPESNLLCILSDYGTGKTTLCRRVAVELARAYRAGKTDGRLPLYIPLRNFYAAGSARALITDWLANECGVANARYSLFLSMIEAGRFILLLDGFDEMVKSTERGHLADCFRALAELNRAAGKTVVAGRPGYFPDLADLNVLVSEQEHRFHWLYTHTGDGRPIPRIFFFTTLELRALSQTQISRIIEQRKNLIASRGYTTPQLREKIREHGHLRDLAKRPVLLDMIIKTFAEVGPRLFARNTAHLYYIYTSLWIDREREKGEIRQSVTSEERRSCIIEIAWRAFISGETRLSRAELIDWLSEYVEVPSHLTVEELASDVETCTFLVPDRFGYLRFYHKSFLEYFAAAKATAHIQSGNAGILETHLLTREVAAFVAEMLEGEEQMLDIITDYVKEHSFGGDVRHNSVLVDLSERSGEGRAIANILLVCALLPGGLNRVPTPGLAVIKTAIDVQLGFQGRDVTNLLMVESRLLRLDLSGSRGRNAHISACVIEEFVGGELKLGDSAVVGTALPGALLRGSRLTSVRFERVNLSSSDLRGSFEKCVFVDSVLRDSTVDGGRFRDCEFRSCDLRGVAFSAAQLVRTRFLSCAADDDRFRNSAPAS